MPKTIRERLNKARLNKARLNMVVSKIIIEVNELNEAYLSSSYPQAQELKKNLEREYVLACEASNKLLGADEFIKTTTTWKEII